MSRNIIYATDCPVYLRNYRKDGTICWNELLLSPVLGKDSQTTHFIGLQQDITRRMNEKIYGMTLLSRFAMKCVLRSPPLKVHCKCSLENQ